MALAPSELLFSLAGKVACVTGASSGLGRASATILAQAGARVVGVARREDQLRDWSENTDGETAVHVADLLTEGDCTAVARAVAQPFGAPDILINAAGVNTRVHADDVASEDWSQTLTLNLSVPFFLAQKLVDGMAARNWGRIVNFASLQSRRAFANGISYGASKGGVEQMTRAMAEAWSARGVLCNALAPGFFPTELTGPVFADEAKTQALAEQTCIGRNGTMEDLAGPLRFLCSSASDYVTGQVLFVDGGFTAK
ncbi:MAG: Gluconate 5-dehydrogenase [Rhodospirillaceae bacterium]|nr:gluconate 5-dehydrogenase [Rhodospirillaceae bacterium]OUX69460.1 MAG: gluconate 5-dehydrogenase [Rhodospirillaceae bacterium TMED140]CAI8410862.1 MAG: Gluconate 5-dehydrogenase [Rhodospirillaceae bacterium]